MAQPPAYFPTYTFRDQEFNANLLPLWDVEFAGISTSINAIRHNLNLIQRDDGLLANNSVHPLSLSPEVLHLFLQHPWRYRSTWQLGTNYDVGDIVLFENGRYIALQCHDAGVCTVPDQDPAPCPECVFQDPENPTPEELRACFQADWTARERWMTLCCNEGQSDCIIDSTGDSIAYQISLPDETVLVDGMRCLVRWHVNSGINSSLQINSLPPKALRFDNTGIDTDDLRQFNFDLVAYNQTSDVFDVVGRDRTTIPTVETPWYTGDVRTTMRKTPADGWTFLDGLTIGNASSGADFSGSQYENLFEILKNAFPNQGTEVWADGDRVSKPNMQTRSPYGWALMSAPGNAPDPSQPEQIMGGNLGSATHQLTVGQIPAHNHTMKSAGNHRHSLKTSSMPNGSGTDRQESAQRDSTHLNQSNYAGNHSHSINNRGGDEPHPILHPVLVLAYEIRL